MTANKKWGLLALLLFMTFNTNAMPIYIGSFNVVDGPVWTSDPDVYSALEGAEIAFGAGSYEISTLGSDPDLINNMAWYSIIGIGFDTFAEDYKKDLPPLGYGVGSWSSGDDISAYVSDRHNGWETKINYVFSTEATVPTPATLALFGLGLAGLGWSRRKQDS